MRMYNEVIDKKLFAFMKDNENWYTSFREDGSCIYHNPINASYMGLQFHKDEKWLDAVAQKICDYHEFRNEYCLIMIDAIPRHIQSNEDEQFCGTINVYVDGKDQPTEICHVHAKSVLLCKKVMMYRAIEAMSIFGCWN